MDPKGSCIYDSDDEDDYELPSLAERVEAALKKDRLQMNQKKIESDSDGEFSNILENLKKTPIVRQVNRKELDSDSDEDFAKIYENFLKTPQAKVRQINRKELDSDSDEDFAKIYEKFLNTPQAKVSQMDHKEDSDSDEDFSNIIKNVLQTPMANQKWQKNTDTSVPDEQDEIKILPIPPKPQPPVITLDDDDEEANSAHCSNTRVDSKVCLRELSSEKSESDSDKEFSNILADICKNRTPVVQKKGVSCIDSESDTEDSFSKIIENIRNGLTPIGRKKGTNLQNNKLGKDSLANICKKLGSIHVSEHEKTNIVPSIVCKKDDSSKKAVSSKSNSVKLRNEEEYAILFPKRLEIFSSKDQTKYGKQLYNFFNEKIFGSELPADVPLIWSGALLRSAGLTCCKRKNEVRSFEIKLSTKLLTTFDRLQDTLLHEMCHAAVWMISKSRENHGPLWKTWASRCKQILPFVNCPERCHSYELPYKVYYHCLNCKWKIGRCKQSQKLQRSVCKTCSGPVVMTRT